VDGQLSAHLSRASYQRRRRDLTLRSATQWLPVAALRLIGATGLLKHTSGMEGRALWKNAPKVSRERSSPIESFRVDRARYPREAWLYERSLWAVATYRFGSWLNFRFGAWTAAQSTPLRYAIKAPLLLGQRLVEVATGIELPHQARIGPGLRIWHGGNVVLNPKTQIGSDCLLRHGVTIGNLVPHGPCPVIGNGVEFGAYAQVLGGITVGDNARIGAMSVVLQDVPPGATAVGVPARIIPARAIDAEHSSS